MALHRPMADIGGLDAELLLQVVGQPASYITDDIQRQLDLIDHKFWQAIGHVEARSFPVYLAKLRFFETYPLDSPIHPNNDSLTKIYEIRASGFDETSVQIRVGFHKCLPLFGEDDMTIRCGSESVSFNMWLGDICRPQLFKLDDYPPSGQRGYDVQVQWWSGNGGLAMAFIFH